MLTAAPEPGPSQPPDLDWDRMQCDVRWDGAGLRVEVRVSVTSSDAAAPRYHEVPRLLLLAGTRKGRREVQFASVPATTDDGQTTFSGTGTLSIGDGLLPWDDVWDLTARVAGNGAATTVGLPGPPDDLPAMIDGHPLVAYATRDGHLAVDPTGRVRDALVAAGPAIVPTEVDGRHRIHARYPGIHTVGKTELTGSVVITRTGRVSLEADDTGARLAFGLDAPDVSAALRLQTRARPAGFGLALREGRLVASSADPGGSYPAQREDDLRPAIFPVGGPRVTVVMATYNSGPALDRVMASLDAQSLAPGEFEIRVVDDGSTDDTYERLLGYARTRPHMTVQRIPNSGWPGRPRNLATAGARGEYVLYLDHDDELFPEALERMHAYGVAHDADVVLGKEVKLGGVSTGWETWRRNVPGTERIDQAVLQCMTPHKLYRRELIERAGITYMEGPVRLECYHFNAQAYVHARSVAVLADYPCYRWILHAGNAHRSRIDLDTYWRSFEISLSPLDGLGVDPETADEIRIRWYTRIVLGRLRGRPTAMRNRIIQDADSILRHFPAHLDRRLSATHRLLSSLYRAEAWGALDDLAAQERGTSLTTERSTASWRDGCLVVHADGILSQGGTPYPLCTTPSGRIARSVPDRVAVAVDPQVLDVTADIAAARVELSLRGRASGIEWPLPGDGAVLVELHDGRPRVRFAVDAEIDPQTAALGGPLADDVWHVRLRSDLLGHEIQGDLPWTGHPAAALVDGIAVTAHTSADGSLVLDIGQIEVNVLGERLEPRSVEISGAGDRQRVVVPLPEVHVRGRTRIEGTLELQSRRPVQVHAVDGQAVIEIGSEPPRHERLAVVLGRARSDTALTVDHSESGPSLVEQAESREEATSPGQRFAVGARRRLGRIVDGLRRTPSRRRS